MQKDNIQKIYSLTPMQEGMLFHTLRDASDAYFTQLFYQTQGDLAVDIFAKSLRVLSQRHDILRTAFVHDKAEQPIQVVLKDRAIALSIEDVSSMSSQEYDHFLEKYRSQDIRKGFDLTQEVLIRLTLFKKGNKEYDFLWSYHHILLDGWSHAILLSELQEIYNALLDANEPVLSPSVPFGQYVKWLERQDHQKTATYWRQYLQGYETTAAFPTVRPSEVGQETASQQKLVLDQTLSQALTTLAKTYSVTTNDILQAAWGFLLAKYNNTNDVVYGNVVSGRPATVAEIEKCLGLFINTIPVRVRFDDADSFVDLAKRVHNDALESLPHHYCSLADIQNETSLGSDLIKHVVAFENYPFERSDLAQDSIWHPSQVEAFDRTNYDLDIDVELSEAIEITFSFNPTLYCSSHITSITSCLKHILRQVAANPIAKLADITLLSQEAKHQLLFQFNSTEEDLGNTVPINVRFEEQAAQCASDVAVIHRSQEWSYAQLNETANQVAHLLKKQGIRPGDFVGLHLARSPELIAALLGVFKAGGVYVPLDTQNPVDRTVALIKDSCIKRLITTSTYINQLEVAINTGSLAGMICMDQLPAKSRQLLQSQQCPAADGREVNSMPTENPENLNAIDSWAYMLYTSGSTGKPKGAITRHDGALNHILAEFKALNLSPGFRFLQSASIASDISVWQIIAPLLRGGSVVIADKDDLLDFDCLVTLMKRHSITIAEFVPSYLVNLVDHLSGLSKADRALPSLAWMMMVGEEVPVKLVNNWLKLFPNSKVLNGYGPCEASDDVTQYTVDRPLAEPLTKVPIGSPIANTNIFVLDQDEKLVPIGAPGEICVSGIGVGAGYFGDAQKTAASFKPNPFEGTLGKMLYKTGDIGRWLPDGNLEFLGRVDRQVKIRGNRLELGELEAHIRDTRLVKNVHVLAHKNSDAETSLLAFIVLNDQDASPSLAGFSSAIPDQEVGVVQRGNYGRITSQLTESCQKALPSHMQPTEFRVVDQIPLNLSNKVDEKKLLSTYHAQVQQTHSASATSRSAVGHTDTELAIKTIWEKVLNRKVPGVDANFFRVGGHSLKATRIVSAIRNKLNAQVTIRDIFAYPTIAQLAGHVAEGLGRNSPQTIAPQQRTAPIPLSFAQERLWFIDRLQGSIPYHIPHVLRLRGPLDAPALQDSLREVIERHESLRTLIKEEKGVPYQEVILSQDWTMGYCPDKGLADQASLHHYISTLVNQPFDLATDYKLRATLIRQSESEHIVVLVLHHIASDGWSESLLVNELTELYAARQEGRIPNLPPLTLQYIDYAIWQRQHQDQLDRQTVYWKDKLANVAPLELTTDFSRPAVQSTRGATVQQTIDVHTQQKLKALSQQEDATLFMMLLATFKVLLYRYTGQDDICVGSPIAGRTHVELEPLIGLFVNTLALRSNPQGNPTFREFLHQVKDTTVEAYAHQDVPFEKVVEAVTTKRDLSRSPLFQVMFTLQNTPVVENISINNLSVEPLPLEDLTTHFDLHFNLEETEEGIALEVEYCADLFRETTIARMIGHYQNLLAAVVHQLDTPISQINYLTDAERDELLHTLAGKTTAIPAQHTVPMLFTQVVHRYPEAVALSDETRQLTYAALNEKANQLAHLLSDECPLRVGNTVGVLMSRSTDFVVAMLAILKCGAAYVPINPDLPTERIRYLMDKAAIRLYITDDEQCLGSFAPRQGIRFDHTALSERPTHDPVVSSFDSRALAYIIFTSGTTGRPKGVMIEHQGIVRLVKDADYISFGPQDALLQTGSMSFDAATFEVWGPLLNGAQVHIVRQDYLLNVNRLTTELESREITKMLLTPSWFNRVVDENPTAFKHLDQLLVGGEALSPSHIKQLQACCPSLVITNAYGPTENSVISICGDTDSEIDHTVPLGKTINNSTVYIVDRHLKLVPKGVAGELLLGGPGLARGYVNDEGKTRQHFIPHPFVPGEYLYRSGDIGRWLDDGRIEFLGRVDDQVKINGYRIELEEIASVVRQHSEVKEAVVTVYENPNNTKVLVGYYTSGGAVAAGALTAYLKQHLPAYMIPTFLVQLKSIPLNSSGKADRKQLPKPELTTDDHIEPKNEVEQTLRTIWSETLALSEKEISTQANFFELGGHSLLVMQVVSRLQVEMRVKVSVATFFKYPTIASLAETLVTLPNNQYLPIPRIPRSAGYEVSHAQKRLWVVDQMKQDQSAYNITGGFEIRGGLNEKGFATAIARVVDRHEILRTNFLANEGLPYQKVYDQGNYQPDLVTVRTEKVEETAYEVLGAEQSYVFDLASDPLVRFRLITDGTRYILLANMHHIISDGWSITLLQRELLALYTQLLKKQTGVLAPLTIHYKDYAAWSNALIADSQKAETYWLNALQGVANRPDLPVDKERTRSERTHGKVLDFALGSLVSRQIRATARKFETSVFIVLQALVKAYLNGYLQSPDVVVGTPISGREHPDLANQIGFYVNMLVLRTYIEESDSFSSLLLRVKDETLRAFEHQHYPYDLLVSKLEPSRATARNPLFDVLISLTEEPGDGGSATDDLELIDLLSTGDDTTSKYDLGFYFETSSNGTISVSLTYRTALFFDSSMQEVQEHFILLVRELLTSPDAPLHGQVASAPAVVSLTDDFS